MGRPSSIQEVLEANSIPEPNSGCWIWMRGLAGGRGTPTYPVWIWEKRRRQVSHLALKTKGIDVPKGYEGCHRCDVPLCVNPDHLFVGTRQENMLDAQAKGRLVGYGKREFCKAGHPLTGDNVYYDVKRGKRACYTCKLRWGRITDAKRRARGRGKAKH